MKETKVSFIIKALFVIVVLIFSFEGTLIFILSNKPLLTILINAINLIVFVFLIIIILNFFLRK